MAGGHLGPESTGGYRRDVQKYVDGLPHLNGSLRELFGVDKNDWASLGKDQGLNHVDRQQAVKAIREKFRERFQEAHRSHEQCLLGQTVFAKGQEDRRRQELAFLAQEVSRCEAIANASDPGSELSKETRLLEQYRSQHDIVVELCRPTSDEDFEAAIAASVSTARLASAARVEKLRLEHNEEALNAYRARTSAILKQRTKLYSDLAGLSASDEHYHDQCEGIRAEIKSLDAQLADAHEQTAVNMMAKLAEASLPPPPKTRAEMRAPMWWRTNLRSYRFLMWLGLVVAICGDQIVMQQLTGPFLGLPTLVQIQLDVTKHIGLLRDAVTAPDKWSAGIALGFDATWGVLALAFGLIPLLLSLPIRKMLDEGHGRYDSTKSHEQVSRYSLIAVAVFLVALLGAAALDSAGRTYQNVARGIALPAITGVLIIGAAWIMHLLFRDKARAHYLHTLQTTETDRLRKRINETQERIDLIHTNVLMARTRIIAANDKYANEDAVAAAMKFDVSLLLKEAFEKAEEAAVAAFEHGYVAGIRVRQQGIEMKEGVTDSRTFQDFIDHLTRLRMTDPQVDGGTSANGHHNGHNNHGGGNGAHDSKH